MSLGADLAIKEEEWNYWQADWHRAADVGYVLEICADLELCCLCPQRNCSKSTQLPYYKNDLKGKMEED